MSFLEVKDIKKSFGNTQVLKGVSFELNKGEVLAIIGSSGSGKTTLLRILNFLEQADGGSIAVNGEILSDGTVESAAKAQNRRSLSIREKRLHFGMVFQSFNLFPHYNILTNVRMAAELLAKEKIKAAKKQIEKEANTEKKAAKAEYKKQLKEIAALPESERAEKRIELKARLKETIDKTIPLEIAEKMVAARNKVLYPSAADAAEAGVIPVLNDEKTRRNVKAKHIFGKNLFDNEIGKVMTDRAIKLLERVGLGDRQTAYPCELSGGQCQRVAIARALALEPDVLCFDEPTSALDPELTGEVLKVIKGLKSSDRTMIVVTHEMEFARGVADKVIFMANGIIEEEGTPEEVFGNPKSEKTIAFLRKSAEAV